MKTEKEKMLNGELYQAGDAVLMNERRNARRLTRIFNQTLETDEIKRIELLQELFGSTGKNLYVEQPSDVIMATTFMLARTSMLILIVYCWMCVKFGLATMLSLRLGCTSIPQRIRWMQRRE